MLPAGIVRDENTFTDAVPNLVNFLYQFDFIDLASRRPIGFKFRFFGFDQAVELEQDFSVGKAIIFDSHLVEGQLLIFVHLVNGVGFAGGLEICQYDGARFIFLDKVCYPNDGYIQTVNFEAERLFHSNDLEVIVGKIFVPGLEN